MRNGRYRWSRAETWLDDSVSNMGAVRLEILWPKSAGYTKDDFKEESRIEHLGMVVGRDVQR